LKKASKLLREYNFYGSLDVSGFQIGGAPSLLGGAFETKENNYNHTTCDFADLTKCLNLASELSQLLSRTKSLPPNKELAPIGLGFATYLPIRKLGLKTPPSLITEELSQKRIKLHNSL